MASPLLSRLFRSGAGLTGGTLSSAAGSAAGGAIRRTLDPVLQAETNAVWTKYPNVPPDAVLLAVGVAQGQVTKKDAYKWASETGYGTTQMDALVNIANTGPPLGSAIQARRRGTLTPEQYIVALNREGIEPQWWAAMADLVATKLPLSDIGNGVQQGHLPGDGLLPDAPTGGPPFTIPLTQIAIDPVTEAATWGVDVERLKVIANLSGLPPADIELLQMWNRGIIDEASVDAGIREGHRKTKWIPAVKELRKAVLSATQYVDARVRGWIKDDEMYAGGALTGHSPEQMDLLFKNHGRPLSFHQVWIGLARGGTYDGPTDQLDPAFLKQLQESDIRPEWYNLAWAQRYSYPAAFVLKALTAAGDLTGDEANTILLYEGWEPTLAAKVSKAWAAKTAPATPPHVKSAATSTITAIAKAYIGGVLTKDEATTKLTEAGEPADLYPALFKQWDVKKSVEAQVTP